MPVLYPVVRTLHFCEAAHLAHIAPPRSTRLLLPIALTTRAGLALSSASRLRLRSALCAMVCTLHHTLGARVLRCVTSPRAAPCSPSVQHRLAFRLAT
eukprot:3920545-Pleurochrysis_carterae.AAC.1